MFKTSNSQFSSQATVTRPQYLHLLLMIAVMNLGWGVTDPAQAQIYKYRDQDGNIVFSDTPPPDAQPEEVEQVELGRTNSAPPPPKVPALQSSSKKPATAAIAYETVITSPPDGTTIPMGPGNFAVTASFSPPLAGGERAQLTLDGTPVGEPQRGSVWQLSNVFRGEHKLIAQRIGRDGKPLDNSPAVTVYVLRPSVR